MNGTHERPHDEGKALESPTKKARLHATGTADNNGTTTTTTTGGGGGGEGVSHHHHHPHTKLEAHPHHPMAVEKEGKMDVRAMIDPERYPAPHSFMGWIEENKHRLKPPIGNALMYTSQTCQFKVMIVGGPNQRTDYHINQGEEWFWQLKGDMTLKIVDNGEFKDVHIKEGQCYLHPARVPHSPQRQANTIGLVVERRRLKTELDGVRWYCSKCKEVVYEHWFYCYDLGSQLKDVVQGYYADEGLRKCKHCGTLDVKPVVKEGFEVGDNKETEGEIVVKKDAKGQPLPYRNPVTHPLPFSFWGWIEDNKAAFAPPVCNKLLSHPMAEFVVMLVGGPNTRTDYHVEDGEEFFYQLKGDMVLKVVDGGKFPDIRIKEGECFLLPAHVPHSPQREANTIGLVLERRRLEEEVDTVRWYCLQCKHVVHEDKFHCVDLGTQLKPVLEKYHGEEELRRCSNCGHVQESAMKRA